MTPSAVQELLRVIWDGEVRRLRFRDTHAATSNSFSNVCYVSQNGVVKEHACKSIDDARRHCQEQISLMRSDIVRCLNPAPYKVAVSEQLYDYMHTLWLHESPVGDLF